MNEARFCVSCGAPLPQVPQQVGQPQPVQWPQQDQSQSADDRLHPGQPHQAPAPAYAQPASQTRAVVPGTAARARRKSNIPLIVAGVAAIVVIAVAAALIIPRLFGSGEPSYQETATNTSLTYGATASADGYDYFYSSTLMAICRAKPGGSDVEKVLLVPTTNENGYEMPEFYVMNIAVTGDDVFYCIMRSEMQASSSYYEVRSVKADGSDDHSVYRAQPDSETNRWINGLYAYDGRAYFGVVSTSFEYDASTINIMSTDAAGEDEQTVCSLDDWSGGTPLITPDHIFYTEYSYGSSASDSHSSVYVRSIDGSSAKQLYEEDGATISSLAINGNKLYCMDYVNGGEMRRLLSIDIETGACEVLYRTDSNENADLLTLYDGAAYLMRYERGTYDASTWDLVRVSLGSGETETVRTNLDYYNPRMAAMNGHLLLLENGQDISSMGVRVGVVDPDDGSVIEEYVS